MALNSQHPSVAKWLKGHIVIIENYSANEANLIVISKSRNEFQLLRAFVLGTDVCTSIDQRAIDPIHIATKLLELRR